MRLISGFLGGRVLKTIEAKGYRPAMGKVREALFSMLQSNGIVWSDTKVLDVYAGTGSLAFESISRGAQKAAFIEIDKKAIECLRHNIDNFKISSQCQILPHEANKVLAREASEAYQLIFVDPPYGEKLFIPTLKNIVQNNWLDEDGFLVAEVEDGLKFSSDYEGLDLIADRSYGQTRILLWKKSSS